MRLARRGLLRANALADAYGLLPAWARDPVGFRAQDAAAREFDLMVEGSHARRHPDRARMVSSIPAWKVVIDGGTTVRSLTASHSL